MEKQQLESRLAEIQSSIESHVNSHNEGLASKNKEIAELTAQRDAFVSEGLARHNFLVGQKAEVEEWLKKPSSPEEV